MSLGWRDHARAAFVAFHLAAVCFMALPAPDGGMNRSAWKDPTVQAEFEAWSARLTSWGYTIESDELEDQGWAFATAYTSVRRELMQPLLPYYNGLGTRQSWRMFVAPHRNPAKLEVRVREGGTWRMVYRPLDADAAWRSEQFNHTRMRSAIFRYAWKHYAKSYLQFVEWIAGHAAVDFPEADLVEVRWRRYRTPSPEQIRAGELPEGSVQRKRVKNLEELRSEGTL